MRRDFIDAGRSYKKELDAWMLEWKARSSWQAEHSNQGLMGVPSEESIQGASNWLNSGLMP